MPKGKYKRKPFTKQHRENMGKAHKERHLSKEIKQKISKAHKGKKLSEEHRQKLSESHKGKKSPMYGRRDENNPRWKGGSEAYWKHKSRRVWEEYHNRKIPKGGIIHHKDENQKNIDPKNLELIESSGRHSKWHAQLRKLKKRTEKFLKGRINE